MQLILVLVLMVLSSPSWAATYYVKKTGNNANSCATAQNSSTPKLTINSALACLTAAGDTLRIGQGTYAESILYSSLPVSGTSSNHITITKIEGENRPLIQPTSGCYGILMHQTRNYIDYIDLNLSGVSINSCPLDSGGSLFSAGSDSGPTGTVIRNVDIMDSPGSNLINGDGLLMEEFVVGGTGWRSHALGQNSANGIYGSRLRNSRIRHGRVYGSQCAAIRTYYSGTTTLTGNNIIEHINAYQNGEGKGLGGVSTCSSGTFIIGDHDNTLRYSVGDDGGRRCVWLFSSPSGTRDNKIYNVTCTRHTYGLVFDSNTTVVNTSVANSIFVDNTTANVFNSGSGTTLTTNRTTGSITACTSGAGVFTHKSGSLCIDAGTNVGLPYNGSAPDIGAFETFTFASCEVPFSAPGTIQITFNSNANVLGDTPTTFTARRNGSGNALTGAATKIGDTIISLPLTATYVGGDTSDISWASGGFTDNARIGGTLNQPFLQTLTNQSCTNNAGGAPTFGFTQAAYRFHGVFGPQATPDIRSVEDVASFSAPKGAAFRLRFALVCSPSDCASNGFYLRYATGGGYTLIPDAFSTGNIALCGTTYSGSMVPSDGAPTTNLLSTGGTFVPGAVIFTASAVPTLTLANGHKSELEYCIRFDTDATGTYTFRLYKQTGEPLDVYTVTPSVTVGDYQANVGF